MVTQKREFFDCISKEWDIKHKQKKEVIKLENFVENLDLKEGEKVLDAGCGNGRLAPFIKKKIKEKGKIIGIDFSEKMINRGKKNGNLKKVSYIQTDIHYLPFKKNSFDSVICLAIFPHLNDKNKALVDIYNVLKPGGKLFIAHLMKRENLNHYHSQIKPVCNDLLPNKLSMKQMLEENGFNNIDIKNRKDSYMATAIKAV